MKTAEVCRTLAAQYRKKAEAEGVSLRMADALRTIANSYIALAAQYEHLIAIGDEETAKQIH